MRGSAGVSPGKRQAQTTRGCSSHLKPNTRQKNTQQARAYSDLSESAAYYDIASSVHNKDILDIVERVADLEFQDLPAERALVRIRENDLHEARTRSCCS